MKKIGLVFKETSENRIKNYIKGSANFFVIKYSGLSSPDLTALRMSLKEAKSSLFVVKNTVARRALKSLNLDALLKSVEGPCGLVFPTEEPVEASKVLYNFSKGHERLVLEGGILDNRLLEKKDIETIAKLPSRQALRAQIVMTLNSPISKFVRVLNQTLSKFVICLNKIKEKKTNEGTPRA